MKQKELLMPVKERSNGYRVMTGKPERKKTTWKTKAQMGE